MVMIEKTRTRRIGKRAVKALPSPSAACRGRRGPAWYVRKPPGPPNVNTITAEK